MKKNLETEVNSVEFCDILHESRISKRIMIEL
jgi:hypothetical protein